MRKLVVIALAGWLVSMSPSLATIAAGTLINMADGSTKPVEALVAGDILAAPSNETRTVVSVAPVAEPGVMRLITTDSGRTLIVSEGHPVPVQNEGGIHIVTSVKVGDIVMTDVNKAEKITSVVDAPADTVAYRLSVGEPGTTARDPLFANGVLISDEPS